MAEPIESRKNVPPKTFDALRDNWIFWESQGGQLWSAAQVLWEHRKAEYARWNDEMRRALDASTEEATQAHLQAATKILPTPPLGALLLTAYAVEVHLKALLVARHWRDPSAHSPKNSTISGSKLSTHDQVALARLCGLDLDPAHERFLRELSQLAEGGARYPVAANQQRTPESRDLEPEAVRQMATAFIQRVKAKKSDYGWTSMP